MILTDGSFLVNSVYSDPENKKTPSDKHQREFLIYCGNYPLTAPAVAPRIIALDRIIYTTMTGRIASIMNM